MLILVIGLNAVDSLEWLGIVTVVVTERLEGFVLAMTSATIAAR